jgi:integrase
MSARHQQGHLYAVKSSNGKPASFHVRYRVVEMVDGQPVRVQRSTKLADRDDRFTSLSCKALLIAKDDFMATVNGTTARQEDLLITEFWDTTYLVHIQREMKPSTLNGYLKIYSKYLSPAFKGLRFSEVTCSTVTKMLTGFVRKHNLSTQSLAHIRSLMSGMFRHAKQLGLIAMNPVHDATSLTKTKASKETHAYSLDEVFAILNALSDNPQEQMIFALAAFSGLRPGELSALKWSDISDDSIQIARAAWRGIVGTTKTTASVASVPLANVIRQQFVEPWRKLCPASIEGWCFPTRVGEPHDMTKLAKRVIVPVLEAKGIAWHGLYSGRRSTATLLTQLTGNVIGAQSVLRHKSPNTTEEFYAKLLRESGTQAMQLVESVVTKRLALPLPPLPALAPVKD